MDNFLYLTRGAVLSYHEFTEPSEERLTDEIWQKNVVSGKITPEESWYKDFSIPTNLMPGGNPLKGYELRYNLLPNSWLP